MRWMRWVQVGFGTLFGLVSLFLLVVAVIRFDPNHAGVLGMPLATLVPGALVVGILELQIRSVRTKDQRVRGSIEQCARQVFDAPGTLRPEYDVSVTASPRVAAFTESFDGRGGFTTDGVYKGVRVSVASHASIAGRQMGEFSHIYSYVCVDVLGATEPFFLTRQGAFGSVATAIGLVKDVQIGDSAFDGAWIIHADQALARDVLDESIRARLNELESKVSLVSINMAQGAMSVVLTRHGLAIRWPGEMSPELAMFMRDLLIDMRARILTHLDRKATAGVGTGYRVSADDRPATEAAPLSEEDPAEPRAAKG